MINRYDKPAEAQFINTYSPIPFDEMLKMGMLKQAKVEKADKDMDAVSQAMRAIKVTPADEPAYLKKAEEATKLLEESLKYGVGSQDQINATNRIKGMMQSDPDFRKWAHNYGVYTDALEQKQKADEKKATPSNTMEIDSIIRNFSEGGKGSAVGMANKGSWSENTDTYNAMEQYVNDVDASSIEKEGTTGQWIVNRKEGGRTLEALASPFGLSFSSVPNKDGKGVSYSSSIKDPAQFRYNLMNKDWGQQYIKNAQFSLGKGPNVVDEEVISLATQEAKGEMVKAINERVTKNTSETIEIDPIWMTDYKASIDNKVTPLVFPQAAVLKGNGIPNSQELFAFSVAADRNVTEAKTSYDSLKQGATSVPIKNDKGEITGYEYKDAKGDDITDEMRKRELSVDLAQTKQQDLVNLKREVRQEAANILSKRLGRTVDPNAEPDMKVKKAAFKDAIKDAVGTSGLPTILTAFETSRGNLSALAELGPEVRDKIKAAYYKRLDEHDPMTKEVNKLLAERAEDKVITIGLQQFSDKRDNAVMAEAFQTYNTPDVEGDFKGVRVGLKDAYTGDPIAKEEYEKLANDKQPLYKGWDINVNTGEAEVHYRPYQKKDKNGNYNFAKDVTTPVPGGFINMLLRENMTTDAEMYVASELARIGSSADGSGVVTLKGADNKIYEVEVTKLSNQQRKNYTGEPEYQLRYTELSKADGTPGITKTTVQTRNQAGAEILNYGIQINNTAVAK